jgi:opacity protein-like surface antigen
MIKRLRKQQGIILAGAFLISTSVSAYTVCPFDGFYLGAAAGNSLTLSKIKDISTASVGIPILGPGGQFYSASSGSTVNLKKNSFAASLFAGYGYSLCSFYLGAEIFAKQTHTGTTQTDIAAFSQVIPGSTANLNVISSVTTKTKNTEFGVDFRPGYLLTDCSLLYARFGAAYNKMTLAASLNFIADSPGNFSTVALPSSESQNKNVLAYRVGAGLEQKVSCNLSVRFDYIFTRYGNITINSSGSVEALNALAGGLATTFAASGTTSKMHNHLFMIGLSYYW